jgi:hypothetical protein
MAVMYNLPNRTFYAQLVNLTKAGKRDVQLLIQVARTGAAVLRAAVQAADFRGSPARVCAGRAVVQCADESCFLGLLQRAVLSAAPR